MCMLVRVFVLPLLIQLHANVSGRATGHGTSACTLVTPWETCMMEIQALVFGLVQLESSWPTGVISANWRVKQHMEYSVFSLPPTHVCVFVCVCFNSAFQIKKLSFYKHLHQKDINCWIMKTRCTFSVKVACFYRFIEFEKQSDKKRGKRGR